MVASQEFLKTVEHAPGGDPPAGLGIRYLAWFLDNIVVMVLLIATFFLAVWCGVVTETAVRETAWALQGGEAVTPDKQDEQGLQALQYLMGLTTLIWSMGSVVYYGCSEFWLHGQTCGKWLLGLRVVRVDGVALGAAEIFVRNLFRLIDQFPPVWIVPLFSKRSQRFGDMVAGTMVVRDSPPQP